MSNYIYQCVLVECSQIFQRKNELQKHIKENHFKIFECRQCNYKSTKMEVQNHAVKMHMEVQIMLWKCTNIEKEAEKKEKIW